MRASGQPTVSVVVMAYDEAACLEVVVREIAGELARLQLPAELIVVDDGSTDATGPIADILAASVQGVRTVHHSENLGLGGVYRTGFAEARGELLTFFPADGQFPAEVIGRFVDAARSFDLVLGFIEPGRRPPLSRVLSLAERALYLVLFGPLPRFQGVLMLRRRLLDELPLHSTGRGWAILLELVVRAARAGCRVCSLPIPVRPRAAGRSKVNNLRTVGSNLRQALALRALLRQQRD